MKAKLLKIVNPLLALAFIAQFASGYLLSYGGAVSTYAWKVHENGAIVLIVLLLAHVILNWTWIKNTFFVRKHVVAK